MSNVTVKIPYETDAMEVIAIPDVGYQFLKWSDGIKTPRRKDKNVSSFLTV